MATPNMTDLAEIAKAHDGHAANQGTLQEMTAGRGSIDVEKMEALTSTKETDVYDDTPTEEEMQTLRRVSGKILWSSYTIAFVELCERFSYYGSSVLYTNFVQHPLPEGSTTGAVSSEDQLPGALGMGQKASTSIGLFNQFWAYLMPLLGAYIADAHLGRYVTIHWAIVVALIAHVVLVASSVPSVLTGNETGSKAAFFLGLILLGVGTGLFKANISPLLAEQNPDTRLRVEVRKGERVIVDPALTNTRIFLYFYMAINMGSLSGQIGMVYVEQRIGFWLAFLLPTVLFLIAPIVLAIFKKTYKLSPPTESVLQKFFQMFFFAMRGKWLKPQTFTWDTVRPSHIPKEDRPKWMTYDDAWVDEVRRGLKACKVFCFLPLFHLAYNQMTGNLTSMAGTMERNGVPNDIIQNLNPISIVIMVPIMDHVIYPGLRWCGVSFTPIKRMSLGFFIGAFAMVAAAVTQYYVYTHPSNPDGYYVTAEGGKADINVWVLTLPFILIGISELFTNVTSYEYAFSKAPENMKSLVMSINLFMSAFASLVGLAFTPLSEDPKLVINYSLIAGLAAAGGAAFWFCFRRLDKEEDKWNTLKKSAYLGKDTGVASDSESVHGGVKGTETTVKTAEA